ncbi:MAG TPA: TonB-dependent receptor plug domain-containing protein [Gemmatimonadaceae bacterium]|nr:TonB-dependent receptor plug domain-containing protein [Gemmatimonadaceae bacterium]
MFRPSFLFCCVLLTAACSSVRPGTRSGPPAGRIITEEKIASYGVNNAWEVLRKSGAYRIVRDDGATNVPNVRSKRGRTSFVLGNSDVPRVIVDGARITDLRTLRDIPAESIAWIQLLGAIEGTLYEGTNSGGGVILIVSKTGG